jgi:hypothetical protein
MLAPPSVVFLEHSVTVLPEFIRFPIIYIVFIFLKLLHF